MTLKGVLSALGRRWYLVLIGLLITAGAAWFAFSVTPAQYAARGLILLLPPPDAEAVDGGNPLLALGGLDLPARVVVATFSTNAAQEDLAERFPDAEAEIAIEESTRGPIISIDVIDTSADGALDTLDYISGRVTDSLQTLQDEVGVPSTAVMRSIPLTMDTEADPDFSDLTRLLILVAVAGLAVTVFAVYALDGLLTRTTRRGRRRTSTEDQDEVLRVDPGPIPKRAFPADPMPASTTRSQPLS
ncbi:MAG: hypothetical protein WBX17_04215 [Microbacterium sp.]